MPGTRYVGRSKFGRVATKNKTRYVGRSKYGRVADVIASPTMEDKLRQRIILGKFGKRNVTREKMQLAISKLSNRAAMEKFGRRMPTGAAIKLAEMKKQM